MPATTGGRPTSRARARQGYKSKPKVRKVRTPAPRPDVTLGGDRSKRTGYAKARTPKPTTQGHPGRGSSGVAGGTKKNPRTKRYKSSTPSLRKQRQRNARRRALLLARDSERWRTGRIQQSGVGDVLKELSKRTVTPAAEVLDQSTRAAEFLAGAEVSALEDIKKRPGLPDPIKAAKAGFKSGVTREDRKHGADVVKTLGVKNKTVQEAAGLVLDIAGDPVTYASFGAGAGVKGAAKAAAKAGGKAEKEALAKGASRKAAKKAKSKASRKKFAETPKNKGISVGFGSHRSSGRASAFVARKTGLNKAFSVKPSTRDAASKAVPIRPSDLTEKEVGALKAADRERRGTIMHETRRTARRGRAIRKEVGERKRRFGKKRIPEGVSARIRDALEKRDLSDLTPAERRAARALEREQERLLDMRRKAGERPSRYRARTYDEQRIDFAAKELNPTRKREAAIHTATRRAATARKHAARVEGATTVRVRQADKRLLAKVRANDEQFAAAYDALQDAKRALSKALKRQRNLAPYTKRGRKAQRSGGHLDEEFAQATKALEAARVLVKERQVAFDIEIERLLGEAEKAVSARARREASPFGDVERLGRPTKAQAERLLRFESKAAQAETELQRLQALRGAPLEEQVRGLFSMADIDAQMARRGRGVIDEPEGYAFRQRASELEGPKRGQPSKRTTTMADFQRGDRRPMAVVREVEPGKYVEDIETTLRVKGQKDVSRAANTKFRGRVMEMGRKLTPKSRWDPETEGVYAVRKTESGTRLVDVSGETFAKGEVVILKRAVADHANEAMEATGRLKFVDPVTNAVKWVLTVPNPQYWARNAYGGTFMAWQSGIRGDRVFANTPTAVRLNRRIRKQHHAEESLTKKMPKGGRVKVLPNGGTMDMNEFIDELERVNISGGGQTTELLGAEFRRRGKAQGAEDFPRLVAYIHWRRQGHSPEESARLTLNSQFDYGDATKFERQWAKRIIPFWTFRSRNVAFQGKTVLQRPGKFATTEKIRDTLARSAGLPEGWQDALQEGEKTQVPIPTPFEVEVPGLGKQDLLLFPGLPVSDLNLYTFNPAALGQQVGSSIHPLAKAVVEFSTNYNFFWRDHIETEGNRWTAAPDELIERLPTPARKALVDAGIIRMGKDRWTGKWSWQWRGKADYLAKLSPLTSVGFAQLTSSLSRKGQSSNMRALGWLTGIRPAPFNPAQGAYSRLLKQIKKMETRKTDMEELGTHKKKGWSRQKNSGEPGWNTREYDRVNDRLGRLYEMKYKLEGELGKKDRAVPQSLKKKDEGFFGDVKPKESEKFFDGVREESKGGFFDDVR